MTRIVIDVGVAGQDGTGDGIRDAFIVVNSNFSGLFTDVDGKAPINHNHNIADITDLQSELNNRALLLHNHAIGEITGLQGALDAKSNVGHTHVISDVSGLSAALDDRATVGSLAALDARVVVLENAPPPTLPYSVPWGFTFPPLESEIMLIHVFAEGVTFPPQFSGSRGSVGVSPSSTTVFSILRDGGVVGSIEVGVNGMVSFQSSGPVVFSPGQTLTIIGPPTTTTIENSAFTLLGTRN